MTMPTEDIHYTGKHGLPLYAKAYGPKAAPLTVLCMHGLTRNHQDFEPMIAGLNGKYRFIAVDVRGRGLSAYDPDPKNYAVPVYVQDMQALLAHIGLKKVALIGTSMGGLMSLMMMKTMPELVHSVIINDIGPSIEKAGLARIASYVGKIKPVTSWAEAATALQTMQGSFFPNLGPDDWLGFARRTFRETEDGRFVLDYDPQISQAFGTANAQPIKRALMHFTLWRLFKAMYAVPLLILRGQNSDILSPKTVEQMLRRHPDARAVNIPNVGHAPLLDEAESLAAIDAFLAGK